MNSDIIIPAPYTKYCPKCYAELEIEDINSQSETKCSNCSYSEPAGNAHYITFLSRALSEYASSLDIENVLIPGIDGQYNELSIFAALEGNALLPVFVDRSQQILNSVGLSNMKGLALGLNLTDDIDENKGGLCQKRVIIDPTHFSLSTSMIILSETIHEAVEMTQHLSNELRGSDICLDYMPNINPNIQMPETPDGSLAQALQKASQTSLGI